MTTVQLLPFTSPGAPQTVVADELVTHACRELPQLAAAGEREQLLLAAWLVSLRSRRTRKAYANDLLAWLAWLGERGIDVLAARRVHVDLWVRAQLDASAAHSTVCRRLSALSSFYQHLASHDLVQGNPTTGVRRPQVDPKATTTMALDRSQARALIAAADADTGPARLRSRAAIRILLHTALRVDELISADIAALGQHRGHRVIQVVRKGGKTARLPLAPATWDALETYLVDRAHRAGLPEWRQLTGPLLATNTGGRLRQSHLWELVRRLASAAGIEFWDALSPHSLRHTAITLALDAGAELRHVQVWAGHADSSTTERYDHSRGNIDTSPTYALATYLA